MADDASRLWHLNDSNLLAHFATVVDPQASSWTMVRTLAPSTASALIGSLSKQQPKTVFRPNASNPPPPLRGAYGTPSVTRSLVTPNACPQTPSLCCKSIPNGCPLTLAPSPPAIDPWRLAQWKTPSVRSARHVQGLGGINPRMVNHHGSVDFHLSLYQAWSKVDDPPLRVKPLPVPVIQ